MDKKIWMVVIILVIVLGAGGWLVYSSYFSGSAMVQVSESQENIEVKNGQEFTIKMVSNPSTGYTWSVSDSYDKNIVEKVSNTFKASDSGMSGAPGEDSWVFKGVGKGSTKLEFKYARSWEASSSDKNKTFSVTVK